MLSLGMETRPEIGQQADLHFEVFINGVLDSQASGPISIIVGDNDICYGNSYLWSSASSKNFNE